jgi:CheY-like chemotaxis protein/HPt (histidine-containing phosphotransfer) domain-containing protein
VAHALLGKRLLAVDDNATARATLVGQLVALGARVEQAGGGPMALEALYQAHDAKDPIAGIVLDLHLAGMDGAAVVRSIKSDEKLREVRIVGLLSPGQRGGDKVRIDGVAAYLAKPVRSCALREALVFAMMGEARPGVVYHEESDSELRALAGDHIRILLAEDNRTNQGVAVAVLHKMGFPLVDVVGNGADAVKALEDLRYDLVLMDIQMPVMDGFEAARRVRAPDSGTCNPKVPIIALTAHAMHGSREQCLQVGMNDHLTKPLKAKALRETLAKWLGQKVDGVCPAIAPPVRDVVVAPLTAEMTEIVFDRTALLDLLEGDEALLRGILSRFIGEIPEAIAELQDGLDRREFKQVACCAHGIKGAAANAGAEALRRTAAEVEAAGKVGDAAVVAALLPTLRQQFQRCHDAVLSALPGL